MDAPQSVEALAKQIDELAGRVAALTAILAHVPELGLSDGRTMKSVMTLAQQLCPATVQTGRRVGSPGAEAENTVIKMASISQSLQAVRDASQG